MRNLKIPRTEIFLLDRGKGKRFATSLYNRSTQPAMLRLCEVGEINSLNTRLPKQDALNRQHFGCEKSSTTIVKCCASFPLSKPGSTHTSLGQT